MPCSRNGRAGLITVAARKGPMPTPRWRPVKVKGKPVSQTIVDDREETALAHVGVLRYERARQALIDEVGRRQVLQLLRRHEWSRQPAAGRIAERTEAARD